MLRYSVIWMLGGCLEPGVASKEEAEDTENPENPQSNEPDSDFSDGGDSGGGSEGSEGSGGSVDGSAGGNESTNTGSFQPEFLLFSFQNGYAGDDIASVSFASGEDASFGYLSIYLYSSAFDDYCAVDWVFDDSTTAPDREYADGMVPNSFYETEIEAWYGFVVLSQPQTRGICDDLHPDWQSTLDALLVDRPGFGYGPLTPDLHLSMDSEHYFGGDLAEYAFTGIASTTAFSEGERIYLPINLGFAYEINEQGMTAFNYENYGHLQGSEIPLDALPSSNGFYLGQYYFGVSLQH